MQPSGNHPSTLPAITHIIYPDTIINPYPPQFDLLTHPKNSLLDDTLIPVEGGGGMRGCLELVCSGCEGMIDTNDKRVSLYRKETIINFDGKQEAKTSYH